VDRIVKEMRRLDLKVPDRKPPEVFLAQLGDVARKRAIAILRQLHEHKFLVAESFSKEGLKAQMEIAAKLNVAYTLIIGQKEILDDTILIRDMENGIQEVIDSRKIISELTKRLRTNGNGNGHA
jgi:histidyl-tRNA synthetase